MKRTFLSLLFLLTTALIYAQLTLKSVSARRSSIIRWYVSTD